MYVFVETNCIIFCNPWVHQCMLFFSCLKSIRSSMAHELFEKLIQRKVPMCFLRLLKHWHKEQTMQVKWASICLTRFMWLMELDKGEYWVHACCIFRWFIHWTKQHQSRVLYWWRLVKSFDVCWWYLCVLSKCTRVAKYTWCVSGLCRIAWHYFQLQ